MSDQMPAGQSSSGTMTYDQAVMTALDLFCNSSEQTYEDFLTSFTHLPASTASGRLGVASGLTAAGRQAEAKTGPGEGGWRADACQDEFDNYLGDSDFNHEEEDLSCNSDQVAMPGEVKEDLPMHSDSICHHTMLEFHTATLDQRESQRSTLGDQEELEEVQPFCLDENFDYDHVVLSTRWPQ